MGFGGKKDRGIVEVSSLIQIKIMILLFFFFLLFVNYVQQFIPVVTYFDEIITIAGVVIVLKNYRYNTLVRQDDKRVIKYICIVSCIGVISTINYHIQPHFAGVWRDALAITKFPICYYAYYLYSKRLDTNQILKRIVPWAKLVVTIIFVLGLVTLIFRVPALYADERYGLPIFTMGYTHNTFLVVTVFVLMATLIASGFRKNLFFIVLGSFCVLFSLRSKPMAALVFLAFTWILRRKGKVHLSKLKMCLYAVIIMVGTYYAAESQISMYLGWGETAARGACYYYGADIANSHFPIGSGFCTFSSSLSGLYYSPLYYEYNMSGMEGLSEYDYSYAADTFWPNVYAQYGWIGLLAYLMMIFHLFKSIHGRFEVLSDSWIAGMMLLVYMVAAAFAEAIFTNDSSVIIAITLTLFIGKDYENSTNPYGIRTRRSRTLCGRPCQ